MHNGGLGGRVYESAAQRSPALTALTARAQHMPVGTPEAAIDAAVSRTLRILKLEGVADVVVGGGANAAANISGGQLKRVSVGVELVSEPRALILDGALDVGGGGAVR